MGGSVLYVVLWSIHHLSAILFLVWSLPCYRTGVELIHSHYGIIV
jgi:hypothetical protein